MDYLMLTAGIMALAGALPNVLTCGRWRDSQRQARSRRIAAIEAGASERYFEEYRALKAFPLKSRSGYWLVLDWIAVIIGVGVLMMGIIGKTAFLALMGTP